MGKDESIKIVCEEIKMRKISVNGVALENLFQIS